jgi:hypothetical protein
MLATGTCEALVKGSNIDEDEFRTHFSFSKGLNPKLSTLKYLTLPQSTTIQKICIYNTCVCVYMGCEIEGLVLNFGAWERWWACGRV